MMKPAFDGYAVTNRIETLDDAHVSALSDAARAPLRFFVNHGFAQTNRGPFHPREVVGALVERKLIARKRGVRAMVTTSRGEVALERIEKPPNDI